MRILALLMLLFTLSCKGEKKQEKLEEKQPAKQAVELKIVAPVSFRSSGLQKVIIPDFEKEYNCTAQLKLYDDVNQLITALVNDEIQADLILGIPSPYYQAIPMDEYLLPHKPKVAGQLYKDAIIDGGYHYIPYAYGLMGVVYNTALLDTPPSSFGEMQDAKLMGKMALVSPYRDEIGRSTLFWMVSLFGEGGYEQLLRAMRKNIYKQYDDHRTALDALIKGEVALMPAPISFPAWVSETSENKGLKHKLFSEGSYLFSVGVAIIKKGKRVALAGEFIDFILQEDKQRMVAFKTGLMPANTRTTLPSSYQLLPYSPWLLNEKLFLSEIREHYHDWLEGYAKVFGY